MEKQDKEKEQQEEEKRLKNRALAKVKCKKL